MRALDALQGDTQSDFLQMVAEFIDSAVTQRCAELLGLTEQPYAQKPSPAVDFKMHREATRGDFDVAAGLSHESIEEDEEAPPITGKASTLTPRELEKDNTVTDPKHEAVSPDGMEMTFSEAFHGMNSLTEAPDLLGGYEEESPVFGELPLIPDKPLPRSNAKKLPKNVKARVSTFENAESAESNSF
jgi:hypothetical protein